VSFEEASTVFADPLAMLKGDPDHSIEELHLARHVHSGQSAGGGIWRASAANSLDQRAPRHAPRTERV
jgi:hypothetical protein